MKKLLFAVFGLVIGLLFAINTVSAQIRLQYPIPDLGYCRDAKECSFYCEIPQNKAACWSYGKYKLGSDVLGVTTMSEEEKEMMRQKAKQYGITFPIAQLGNCAGPQECRDFCEQPGNQQTCMDFAKKKGFHKEMEDSGGMDRQKKEELIEKAKTELGCTSMEECSRVCETDHSRCEAFARKHGVYQGPPSSGRYSAEEKMQLMEKARSELGCTSMESCKSTCEKNPEHCMEFAKKHGFHKEPDQQQQQYYQYQPGQYQQGAPQGASANYGIQRFGKGSCDSEESCKKYCQEHPDECPGFQGYSRATEGGVTQQQQQGSYIGPSGCRTESECKSWCETHPDQCPGFREAKTLEESAQREYELREQYQNYQPPTTTIYPSYPTMGTQYSAPTPELTSPMKN